MNNGNCIVKKPNLKFSLLQGSYWSAFCMIFSFLVTYLSYHGYSTIHIGIIMTIISVTNFVAQPIFGYLNDNFISEKKLFIVFSILAIPTLFFLQKIVSNFGALIAASIFIGLFLRQFPSLIDSWTVKVQNNQNNINYGITRGMGSISYAVSALVFGKIFEVYSIEYLFIACAGFVIVSIIVSLTINEVKIKKDKDKKPAFKTLFKNPKYRLLIICGFLCTFGLAIASIYFPILLEQLGGTSYDLGLSFFILALSEAPVMFLFNRFANRIKLNKLLLVAFIFYILRSASFIVAPNVTILIILQVLQSLSFGLFYPTAIRYIYEIVDSENISTAIMTFSSFAMAISSILATSVGGFMIDAFGIYSIYYLATLTCVISVIVFIIGQLIQKNHANIKAEVA